MNFYKLYFRFGYMKTKNSVLRSFCKIPTTLMVVISLVGCTTTDISHSGYQVKQSADSQLIKVSRDSKEYCRNKADTQDCPITFYINNKNAGDYLVNEQLDYYLEPGDYYLQVKNCQGRCSAYGLDVVVKAQISPPTFILSLDAKGNPFIIRK